MSTLSSPLSLLLKQQTQVLGPGWASGKLYDLGNFPGIVIDEAASTLVKGEILQIHHPHWFLPILDEYEMIGPAPKASDYYRRILTKVHFKDQLLECWVYHFQQDVSSYTLIAAGDYYLYLQTDN